jgi:hypothetical protein
MGHVFLSTTWVQEETMLQWIFNVASSRRELGYQVMD